MTMPRADSIDWSSIPSIAAAHIGYFENLDGLNDSVAVIVSPCTILHIWDLEPGSLESGAVELAREIQRVHGESEIVSASWFRHPCAEHVMWVGFDPSNVHVIAQ